MDKYYDLLKASFDRGLTAEEKETLNAAMMKFPELQAEARKLQKIRDLLIIQQYNFSPGFVQKIIVRLKNHIDNSINYAFVRIAIPGLAAAIALLLVSLFSSGQASLDTLIGIDLLKPEYLTDFIFYTK
jgi:hypothetical protein